MSKAGEALTDVRRWLCDNLSDGEAGKVCGMLSVVSRHINELEAENARLRELVVQAHECKTNDGCCEDCYQDEGCCPIERDMEELGIEVEK